MRGELEGLFSLVSRPVRGVAGIIYRRVYPSTPMDVVSPQVARTPQTVLEENARLWLEMSNLQMKFDQLNQLNEDRKMVGDVRPLCKPAAVTGADSSGFRESLLLSQSGFSGFKNEMPVLFSGGLVGKITAAGLGGAQVQLITDPAFKVTGRIGQYKTDADGHQKLEWVEHLQPLVQGMGHGAMAIRNMISMEQVKDLGIGVNDLVVLDDREWPPNLQGYWVGRVTAVHPQQNAPLFADIRIEPISNLMRLKEVMVMVKN